MSGKSTLADAIKKAFPDFIILRMDELRKIVTPEPTYSETEREIVYRALVYLAITLTGLGHDVIMDATGNLRRWRDLARELIPRYGEVYLHCSIETCRKREEVRADKHGAPGHIYEKAAAGWPVPGVSVNYEEPLSPELLIETEKTLPQDAVTLIKDLIERLKVKA